MSDVSEKHESALALLKDRGCDAAIFDFGFVLGAAKDGRGFRSPDAGAWGWREWAAKTPAEMAATLESAIKPRGSETNGGEA